MPSDYLDYENLAFPPQEIKSQDDLNQDDGVGRTMTLLKAIEQLEKTEVELEKVETENKMLKELLKECKEEFSRINCGYDYIAKEALTKIKEIK